MSLLREFVRSVICEDFDDVIDVIVRIRVRIQGQGSRTLRDVLTDIRGLVNVITVEQIGKISDHDIGGRSFVALNIKFEDDEEYGVTDLLRDIGRISDVDMIRFVKTKDSHV